MKFSVTYYLLLLYVTVMLKPLAPVICDAWNHAFAEAQHIATVHARYGANHLEKQLANGEQDNNKSDNIKSAEPVPVHLLADATYPTATVATHTVHFSIPVLRKLPSSPQTIIVPPPELL